LQQGLGMRPVPPWSKKFAEGWPRAPISLRKGPFNSHLEQFRSRAYHAARPPRKATDKKSATGPRLVCPNSASILPYPSHLR